MNIDRGEQALGRLLAQLNKTARPGPGHGALVLPIGFFANVLDLGHGQGLAISTDGVGTKLLIAQEMDRYDTIGIDCVAMNVNDVLCVGAEPISLVDYIAVQEPDPFYIEELARGLARGCALSQINIAGGEIAQLRDVLQGVPGRFAFDLVGTCVGTVSLDQVIVGRDLADGDVIIGIGSSGIHSNGLTLARRALTEQRGLSLQEYIPELGRKLGEELLEPTRIYTPEIMALLQSDVRVKALANITGGGLLNVCRFDADVTYRIERFPDPPAVFDLIQRAGQVDDPEMFRTFNMGIGFCVIVDPADSSVAARMIQEAGGEPLVLGHVEGTPGRRVIVEPKGLLGAGQAFEQFR